LIPSPTIATDVPAACNIPNCTRFVKKITFAQLNQMKNF
jgi:hypothetical protein